jgi:hypothetical protein
VRARLDVTGDREIIRDLLQLGADGITAGKEVLGETTKRIAVKAKAITPVDPIDGGELRESVRATKPQAAKSGKITSSVVAGGPALARLVSERGHKEPGSYAIIVHESADLRHSVGQWKFIETPALQEAPSVPGALLEAIDKRRR